MDDWEKFNKTSLPEKEDFYSHLNMENITDADYAHAKKVFKGFEIKNFEVNIFQNQKIYRKQKYHSKYLKNTNIRFDNVEILLPWIY